MNAWIMSPPKAYYAQYVIGLQHFARAQSLLVLSSAGFKAFPHDCVVDCVLFAALPSIQPHFPLDLGQNVSWFGDRLVRHHVRFIHLEPLPCLRGHFTKYLQFLLSHFVLGERVALEFSVKLLRVEETRSFVTRDVLASLGRRQISLDIFVEVEKLDGQ